MTKTDSKTFNSDRQKYLEQSGMEMWAFLV